MSRDPGEWVHGFGHQGVTYETESQMVQRFVRDVQVLAGRFESEDADAISAHMDNAFDRMSGVLSPLVFWTIHGITTDTLQRLQSALVPGTQHYSVSVEVGSGVYSTAALRTAVHRWRAAYDVSPSNGVLGHTRARRALGYIRAHCDSRSLSLDVVASAVGLSRWHLGRLLTHCAGGSYSQLVRRARMRKATTLLTDDRLSIKEVAAKLGYPYPTEFSRDFRRSFNMTPSAWRKTPQVDGVVIEWRGAHKRAVAEVADPTAAVSTSPTAGQAPGEESLLSGALLSVEV